MKFFPFNKSGFPSAFYSNNFCVADFFMYWATIFGTNQQELLNNSKTHICRYGKWPMQILKYISFVIGGKNRAIIGYFIKYIVTMWNNR